MAEGTSLTPAVAALAGRRIDALDAEVPRFPSTETEYVTRKLLYRFRLERVERLVCSAACGADILALEAAAELGIPATLVLPFASSIFRETSVTDRPGNWGERFDGLVAAARNRGDLVELRQDPGDESAFAAANDRIIHTASTSATYRHLAFVVWEGRSRGPDDSTADFLRKALSCGFEKRVVFTTRRAR